MSTGGFVMVPEWLRRKRPSPNAFAAYITLGSFGTFKLRDGTYEQCRPSMKTMVEESGMTESVMKRAINELIKLGAARRIRRTNPDGSCAPSAYVLIFGELKAPDSGQFVDGSVNGPREGPERPGVGPGTDPNQEPSTKNQITKKSSLLRSEQRTLSHDGDDGSRATATPSSDRERDRQTKAQKPKSAKATASPPAADAPKLTVVDQLLASETDVTDDERAKFRDHLKTGQRGRSFIGYLRGFQPGDLQANLDEWRATYRPAIPQQRKPPPEPEPEPEVFVCDDHGSYAAKSCTWCDLTRWHRERNGVKPPHLARWQREMWDQITAQQNADALQDAYA